MMSDSRYLAAKMLQDKNVCGMQIVFADIFAYSRRKTYSQVETIQAFTSCFKQAVGATARAYTNEMASMDAHLQRDIVALHTGDGVAVAFPFDGLPGLSLDFVDELITAVNANNNTGEACVEFAKHGFCDCHPKLLLRIGISEGQCVLYRDFTERFNIAGNQVNLAARVMALAEPGQVMFTDNAFQTLEEHVARREGQFRTYQKAEIKHGLRIDVHQYINDSLRGLDVTARAGLGLMEGETQPDIVDVPDGAEPAHADAVNGGSTALTADLRSERCPVKQQMVPVDDLTFRMGTDASGRVEVTFSRPFLISSRLVTQEDYQSVMGRNPSHFIGESRPVEMVSWFDAVQFCNELSASELLEAVYEIVGQEVTPDLTRDGYRLPTEAEWEFCCRAERDDEGRYGPIDEIAWYSANADGHTNPVCDLLPNRGVYDLLGNVWEWCGDWFQRGHPADPQVDYVGPATGYERVLRGGSWRDLPACITAGYRHHTIPSKRESTIGFRVVRTPTKPEP